MKIDIKIELIEELKGLIARSDDERIGRIKTKHEIGLLLIKKGYRKGRKGSKKFLDDLAEAVGVCYAYLRECVKLVESYPNFDNLLSSLNIREDRDITWTYIRENLIYEDKKDKRILDDMKVKVKKASIDISLVGKAYKEYFKLYSKLLKGNIDNSPSNLENFVKDCAQKGAEVWEEILKRK
jgi:hypothetical protein